MKALDTAIAEAEAARYPEIASELRKARESLQNLGGGRGGQFVQNIAKNHVF